MNTDLTPIINEIVKYTKKIEQDRKNNISDNFAENWNNLRYAVSQLVCKTDNDDNYIMPMVGRISAPFGEKRKNVKGQTYYHTGIDIADNPANKTPIVATNDGVVVFAGDANDGYGIKVVIDHGEGIESLYAHCSKAMVREGVQIKKGRLIAFVGSTGHSTGPHLHFEIRVNKKCVDPMKYIKEA